MSIVIKNKFTAAALAISTIMGMGYSSLASAADSVEFRANIAVTSTYACSYSTAPEGATEWNLAWDLPADTAPSGTLTFTGAPTAPLTVKVTSAVGNAGTCNLNDMKFSADMGGATNVVAGDNNAYKVQTNGGFWRFMPVVAKLELFAGADAASSPVDITKIAVVDANGAQHTQTVAVQKAAQQQIASGALLDFGALDAYTVSDNYLAVNGVTPLAKGTAAADVSFTNTDGANPDVKSAILGVGVIVAANPEDSVGAVDVKAVIDAESVSMPFTVNVDYA